MMNLPGFFLMPTERINCLNENDFDEWIGWNDLEADLLMFLFDVVFQQCVSLSTW